MSGDEKRADRGALVLVATPIGNLGDLSARAKETLATADVICCEDTRHTGLLLSRLGISARRLISLHAHNESARSGEVVALIESGATVVLVSDAGTPLISDPGARLVRAAIEAAVVIQAVPGPSAVIDALVLSGLPTERFVFEGFLPRKGVERRRRLEQIARSPMPSVIYEAPGRVRTTLAELEPFLGASRRICLARELTKLFEQVWRGTVADAVALLEHTPARGEYVVVVDGAPAEDASSLDLDAALGALFTAGLGAREAVAALGALQGVAHRVAYARALELRAGDEGDTAGAAR